MRARMVWLILMVLAAVVGVSGCSGAGGGDTSAGTGEPKAPPPSRDEIIQQHLAGRELDPIEGIWLWDSGEYEAAIFKGSDSRHPGYEYIAVLTSSKIYNWGIGEVKVALRRTASENVYAVAYYYSDKSQQGAIATLVNGTILQMNLPQIGQTALVKVYPIKGKADVKPARMGAGFFVAKDVAATSHHLVAEAKQLWVTFGGTRFGAKVLAGDKVNDLALLKVEFPGDEAGKSQTQAGIVPLALGDVRTLKQGDKVSAGGFPPDGDPKKGVGVYDSVVSSIAANGDPRLLQVNMPSLPMNVGGPVLNVRGEVVGVSTSTSGVNLAVKASYLANLLTMLPPETTLGSAPPADGEFTSNQLIDEVSKALVLVEAQD